MPACEPVNDTASTPRRWIAIAVSAIEMRSPAVSSMSISRAGGSGLTAEARVINSSVVFPIADTTTTTSWPPALVAQILSATAEILSGEATELPPYFWTMSMGP